MFYFLKYNYLFIYDRKQDQTTFFCFWLFIFYYLEKKFLFLINLNFLKKEMSKLFEPKELDEKSLKIAKKELNEKDAKQVAADIQYVREWILKQDYMKSRTDDAFILSFLRVSKFSYARAQELIKNYWSHRAEMPELFQNRNLNDDSILMEISDLGIMCVLPYPDSEGRTILINRFGVWEPSKYEVCLD